MSKSERLAALIEAVVAFDDGPGEWTDVMRALIDYQDTPDDQPPEIPVSVARLLAWGHKWMTTEDRVALLGPVEDHYRRPLKLEVGKCYADTNGEVGKVFWFDKAKSLFHAVMLETGIQRHCHADGRSHYQSHPDFVREVKND